MAQFLEQKVQAMIPVPPPSKPVNLYKKAEEGFLESSVLKQHEVIYSESEVSDDAEIGKEDDSDFDSTQDEDEDDFDFEEEIWTLKRQVKKVREFELYIEKKMYEKFKKAANKTIQGDEQNKLFINSISKEIDDLIKQRKKDRIDDLNSQAMMKKVVADLNRKFLAEETNMSAISEIAANLVESV
jgi:hypothetical protein